MQTGGTSAPETSLDAPVANKGKAPMGSLPRRHGKRTRLAEDALLPPDVIARDFDPFEVLDPMWSSGAISERD